MKNKKEIIYKILDLYEENFESYTYSYDIEIEILSSMISELDFTTIDNYYSAIKRIIEKHSIKEDVIQMLESEYGAEKIIQRIVIEKLEEIVENIEFDKEIKDIENGNIDLKDIDIEKIDKEHIIAKYSYILKSSNEDYDLAEKRLKEEIIDYFENQDIYKFYSIYKLLLVDVQSKRATKNKYKNAL